ncbi:MAG: DUF3473 domain-containing protein [Planctomycetota bacterium]|nr:MAG: DUF3473 domain-containing protein [Planctomycetota bacterium]
MEHLLTIDVEDNFTPEELQDPEDWARYEGQVVENTDRILRLLKPTGTKATFFVVAKTAERRPELVQNIAAAGHEVASHSYSHQPLDQMSKAQVEEEIQRSGEILRQQSGQRVAGFRAMDFSIPEDPDLFHRLLHQHGYRYDSSAKGCWDSSPQAPNGQSLGRIYPSRVPILGRFPVFSGGAYLRFCPRSVIRKGFKANEAMNRPVTLYVHPWEFNRDQPKRKISGAQKLKQSPWTFSTAAKLRWLLKRYRFTSIAHYFRISP